MTRIVTYQPEQIERGRKRLLALPVKDMGKTKEETAGILAKDIRAILKRGYTLKELAAVLREEGLILPASLMEGALGVEEKPVPPEQTPAHSAAQKSKTAPRKEQKNMPAPAPSYPAVTPDMDLSEL